MSMKCFLLMAIVAACGGKQPPPTNGAGSGAPVGVAQDTRTPFEKRLDEACKAVEPKIVECTVADAKAEVAAGRMKQKDFDELTKPQFLEKLADEWDEKCDRRERSSRQVRVLEVCHKEETECAPLLDCLAHFDKAN